MKQIFRLTIILLFLGCNSKENRSLNNFIYEASFKQNNKYNSYLIENIDNNIESLAENNDAKEYYAQTSQYLKYITGLESEISKNSTKIFFDQNNYSKTAKEFESESNKYKEAILALSKDSNFKKRINFILNTNALHHSPNQISENNETGEMRPNETYINYLEYYFRDIPNEAALSFLSDRRRNILELENEYLTSLR